MVAINLNLKYVFSFQKHSKISKFNLRYVTFKLAVIQQKGFGINGCVLANNPARQKANLESTT